MLCSHITFDTYSKWCKFPVPASTILPVFNSDSQRGLFPKFSFSFQKINHYHILFILNIKALHYPSFLEFSRPALPTLLHFSAILHLFIYRLPEQRQKLLCYGFHEVLIKRLNVITNLCVPFLATHSESPFCHCFHSTGPPDHPHVSESLLWFAAVLIPICGIRHKGDLWDRHLPMQVAYFDCYETNNKAVILYCS